MNNDITLHGLVINNGKCSISPTIYLDYYYKEFENGADIDKLAKQVIAQYKKFELDEDFDISVFTDYEKCKDNYSVTSLFKLCPIILFVMPGSIPLFLAYVANVCLESIFHKVHS